jgi:hypothetical protein
VTPCAVCIMHMETRSVDFLVEPQNQCRRVFQFGPQIRQLQFVDLGLKITATVLGLVSKPSEPRFVGFVTKPTE